MRPPRRTLQPLGQQLTDTVPPAPTTSFTMPMLGRVRARPLPGVVVLPAPIVEEMS